MSLSDTLHEFGWPDGFAPGTVLIGSPDTPFCVLHWDPINQVEGGFLAEVWVCDIDHHGAATRRCLRIPIQVDGRMPWGTLGGEHIERPSEHPWIELYLNLDRSELLFTHEPNEE